MYSYVLSTAVLICSSPSWHSKLLQPMPSSHDLLSSCTNTSLGPPSLPKSAKLTQQPLKFVNGLLPVLTPSDHRLINTANILHPCMLVSQLPCMIPFTRFGSPLQWYVSYPRTATRYAPVMVRSTATQDDTCVNAVSNLLTLSQMPQQLHCRLLPNPMSPCCSLHLPSLYNQCSPMPVAPAMPVTPKPQVTAVPTMPAVPKVAPVSMPVTPSAAPMQPRSGCAHVVPKHLIQEI